MWEAVPLPAAPVATTVNDVTCASVSDCSAVGSITTGNTSATDHDRVLHWNGTAWSDVTLPASHSAAVAGEDLSGVSCSTRGDCWAVGTTVLAHGTAGQAWHYNGALWKQVAVPSRGQWANLDGVSCTHGQCYVVDLIATGLTTFRHLVVHWAHGKWTAAAVPTIGEFTDMTCAGVADCWLAGSLVEDGGKVNVVMHWNGHRWATVAVPQPAGKSGRNQLSGITCTSAAACWAVGSWQAAGSDLEQPQVLQWNGTWRAQPTPKAHAPGGKLLAVVCTNPAACTALGVQRVPNSEGAALYLRWNGTRWMP